MTHNSLLRVVLIEPEFPGNLGSVARAMGNMGFDELVLVDPIAEIDHKDS
jgi:tRNA C32,U32 (ribose-2'-O)-methylase TrmJ